VIKPVDHILMQYVLAAFGGAPKLVDKTVIGTMPAHEKIDGFHTHFIRLSRDGY
jgi:hypothetical protein